MRDLVKYPLESGGFVFIETEVAQVEKEGLVKAGRGLPDEAAQSFEATISSLSPIASSIVSKLINRGFSKAKLLMVESLAEDDFIVLLLPFLDTHGIFAYPEPE
jgi:hypothetical protein